MQKRLSTSKAALTLRKEERCTTYRLRKRKEVANGYGLHKMAGYSGQKRVNETLKGWSAVRQCPREGHWIEASSEKQSVVRQVRSGHPPKVEWRKQGQKSNLALIPSRKSWRTIFDHFIHFYATIYIHNLGYKKKERKEEKGKK